MFDYKCYDEMKCLIYKNVIINKKKQKKPPRLCRLFSFYVDQNQQGQVFTSLLQLNIYFVLECHMISSILHQLKFGYLNIVNKPQPPYFIF